MPITTSARDPRYRKQAKQQVKIQRAANKRKSQDRETGNMICTHEIEAGGGIEGIALEPQK
jgi:hypothetical protein